jgi:hypothetical protein
MWRVAANARIKSNQGFVKENENNPKALPRFYAAKENKKVYVRFFFVIRLKIK